MKTLSPLANTLAALAAVTSLTSAPSAALGSDSWSPAGEDLAWTGSNDVVRVDNCRTLTIKGKVTVEHPNEGEIDVTCDTMVFEKDAVLVTNSDLAIQVRVVKGTPKILGSIEPNRHEAARIAALEQQLMSSQRSALASLPRPASGGTGSHGGNGRDAGIKYRFPHKVYKWSSTAGGGGGTGGQGAPGRKGIDGASGQRGSDGRNISFEFDQIEQARDIIVESNGLNGLNGHAGTPGQMGGNGGQGGNGGKGGSANHGMSASRGGNGGNGGRGGNGGPGGNGGQAGDGGNGGNIQIVCNGDLAQLEGVAFNLSAEGGQPGRPGAGGPGGQGGPGGAPGHCGRGGDGSWFNSNGSGCAMGGSHGSAGAKGSPGVTGAPGREGNPGSKSYPKVFVRVNGDLEPFPYE